MVTDDTIVFQTEDSLWRMLADGSKTFDMRKWDLSDNRIYRLSWFKAQDFWKTDHSVYESSVGRHPQYARYTKVPEEGRVAFRNKATGTLLCFEYKGVEFATWAPGWGFIQLGKLIWRTEGEPHA